MPKFLISVVALAALSACADFGRVAPAFGVSVYKYVGSKQCSGGGTPLATMMRQLSDGGIPVMNVNCGTDGRIYPAMCGAPDGRVAIFELSSADAQASSKLGFAPLSTLPDAKVVPCK